MTVRRFPSAARSGVLRARSITAGLLLTLFLMPMLASQAVSLAVSDSGRWTPPHPMSGVAIHMALLPGDGTRFNSEVLWWTGLNDEEGPFGGGLWGWRPPAYNCTAYPDTNVLQDIPLQEPAAGVFCASNSGLFDGRLFVAGGTQPGTENGVRHAYIFDPRTATWTPVDSMSEARWYTTSVALADSRQLVLSGSKDQWIYFFGGRRYGEAVPRDKGLFRYGIGYNGHADVPVYPGNGADWPAPREGHTVVLNTVQPNWGIHMFGGRDSVQYFDQYWQLTRDINTFGSDYTYAWKRPAIDGSSPPALWDHSAITTPDTLAVMIIYGGIKKVFGNPVVTDEVWRLHLNSSLNKYQWTLVTTTGESPGVRCGHTAFYHAASRRMLVFGGRGTTDGDPTDNALWGLQFDPSFNTATWQRFHTTGPSARYHHAGFFDGAYVHADRDRNRGIDSSYAFVFGGQLANRKANDLWQLRIEPDTTWQQITWLAGTRPSPRSGHTINVAGSMLYVFGGSATDDTVYAAHLDSTEAGTQRTWVNFRTHAPALSGQAAIFDGSGAWARYPEIFDPSQEANHNPSLQWTRLNYPYKMSWYPQAFEYKSDTVFVSGPADTTYKLSLSVGNWIPFPQGSSGFLGGSAVMYRPGMVMKCGSRDIEVGGSVPTVGTTKRLDLTAGASATWVPSADPQMLPRVNHNLVMLPNGRVLVVGGGKDIGTSPEHRPEIWDPHGGGGTGAWFGRDTLAPEPLLRDYHGLALLLPDARLMSAGGNADTTAYYKAEIFCPPYLFNSDGSLAARPGLVEAPRLVRYGAQDTLCRSSSDDISMVSLIRPAAVTHGCRVRARRYRRALPLEPDGMVAHHPARAEAKGRRGGPSSHVETEG